MREGLRKVTVAIAAATSLNACAPRSSLRHEGRAPAAAREQRKPSMEEMINNMRVFLSVRGAEKITFEEYISSDDMPDEDHWSPEERRNLELFYESEYENKTNKDAIYYKSITVKYYYKNTEDFQEKDRRISEKDIWRTIDFLVKEFSD